MSIVGLCLGSFATALFYRIPRGLSWILVSNRAGENKTPARSQCPDCGHTLEIKDLVPVFSWIFSGGRCRYCGLKISSSYPFIELLTLILTVGIYISWGLTLISLPLYAAIPFLVAAIAIDWKYMVLPNILNAIFFILAAIFTIILWEQKDFTPLLIIDHITASVFLTGALFLSSRIIGWVKKRPSLGGGDLKFLPSAGLFLGLAALPSFCVLAGILGIFTAVFKFRNETQKRFPFGPALLASLYVHLFLTGIGFDYTWPYSFPG